MGESTQAAMDQEPEDISLALTDIGSDLLAGDRQQVKKDILERLAGLECGISSALRQTTSAADVGNLERLSEAVASARRVMLRY